jgi:hypothetical protein
MFLLYNEWKLIKFSFERSCQIFLRCMDLGFMWGILLQFFVNNGTILVHMTNNRYSIEQKMRAIENIRSGNSSIRSEGKTDRRIKNNGT